MSDVYNAVCDYFSEVYYSPDKVIGKFEPVYNQLLKQDLDTLVGTGLSGGIIVPMIAKAYDLNYMLVRKPGATTHDTSRVFGKVGQSWLFVDDFICSGATLRRVQRMLTREIPFKHETRMLGGWMYSKEELHLMNPDVNGIGFQMRDSYVWKPRNVELIEENRQIQENSVYILFRDYYDDTFYVVRRDFMHWGEEEPEDCDDAYTVGYPLPNKFLEVEQGVYSINLEHREFFYIQQEPGIHVVDKLDDCLKRLQRVISTQD